MTALKRRERRISLFGVMLAMAIVNLVYGIAFPLLALVLDAQGVSKTLIGLNTVVQAAAVFFVAPWAPKWLARIPAPRMMQLVLAVLTGSFILAGLFPNVWFWFPLRFLIGAAASMLWISSEAVINDLADEARRGRIIGLYSSVGAAGFALGPLLLILTGSEGMLPFYATSALIFCAGLPLIWVSHQPAKPDESETTGLWKIFLIAPTIMVANIVYASAAESLLTFFPLFGISLGLTEEYSLYLLTVLALGGMVLLLPISWLADHFNRYGLLLICTLLTLAGLVAMPWLVGLPVLGQVFAFLFGGFEGMIYALSLILLGQRFKGAMLASATTVFTACWGTGTIVGPLLVGVGMDSMGDRTMAWVIAAIYLLFLPLPLRSWWRNRSARSNQSRSES